MKGIFVFAVAVMISGLFGCASLENETATAQTRETKRNQPTKPIQSKSKPAVLVELFTSEGCSSCPPADRVLSQLEKQQPNGNEAEIITLALHVDYWNYLGWKDEFSQKQFSERQSGYADRFKLDSIYTPQMVVDGQTQFVGSNLGNANKAISDAAKSQKANIEISNAADKLKVKIIDAPTHDDAYVWLAIAEDDLKTNVRRGENGGKTLDHVSVVREMKLLGDLAAADKTFEAETALQFNSAWRRENLKFVVFVQGKESKKVFGAVKLDN
jgi:hypothetical protein